MQLAGLGKKRNLSEVSSLAHAPPLFKVLFDTLLLNTILDLTYIIIVTVHSIDSLH